MSAPSHDTFQHIIQVLVLLAGVLSPQGVVGAPDGV